MSVYIFINRDSNFSSAPFLLLCGLNCTYCAILVLLITNASFAQFPVFNIFLCLHTMDNSYLYRKDAYMLLVIALFAENRWY